MDQERDTIGNDQSSQRRRFWRENPPLPPGSSQEKVHIQPFDPSASKGFHEIHSADSTPHSESLPILFELPDRTPEAARKRQDSPQFTLHNAHAGPPASHVDPPSGNHSHLVHSGPISPMGSDSIDPDANASEIQGPRRRNPPNAETIPENDHKVAAFRDETMSWAKNLKGSWVAPSAIVSLMLAMVTLAFFSGRGLRPGSPPTDQSRLSEIESGSDQFDESVVVMIDDLEMLEDLARPSDTEVPKDFDPMSRNASDNAGQEILDAIANLPPDDSRFPEIPTVDLLPEVFQPDSDADLPSYIVDSSRPSTAGSLGKPSASVAKDDAVADQIFPTVEITAAHPGLPTIAPSPDSVVSYRKPDQTGIEKGVPSNDLPSGMDDRLKLEDGLRYSDTPHPIGNFLEILQTWEASESQ